MTRPLDTSPPRPLPRRQTPTPARRQAQARLVRRRVAAKASHRALPLAALPLAIGGLPGRSARADAAAATPSPTSTVPAWRTDASVTGPQTQTAVTHKQFADALGTQVTFVSALREWRDTLRGQGAFARREYAPLQFAGEKLQLAIGRQNAPLAMTSWSGDGSPSGAEAHLGIISVGSTYKPATMQRALAAFDHATEDAPLATPSVSSLNWVALDPLKRKDASLQLSLARGRRELVSGDASSAISGSALGASGQFALPLGWKLRGNWTQSALDTATGPERAWTVNADGPIVHPWGEAKATASYSATDAGFATLANPTASVGDRSGRVAVQQDVAVGLVTGSLKVSADQSRRPSMASAIVGDKVGEGNLEGGANFRVKLTPVLSLVGSGLVRAGEQNFVNQPVELVAPPVVSAASVTTGTTATGTTATGATATGTSTAGTVAAAANPAAPVAVIGIGNGTTAASDASVLGTTVPGPTTGATGTATAATTPPTTESGDATAATGATNQGSAAGTTASGGSDTAGAAAGAIATPGIGSGGAEPAPLPVAGIAPPAPAATTAAPSGTESSGGASTGAVASAATASNAAPSGPTASGTPAAAPITPGIEPVATTSTTATANTTAGTAPTTIGSGSATAPDIFSHTNPALPVRSDLTRAAGADVGVELALSRSLSCTVSTGYTRTMNTRYLFDDWQPQALSDENRLGLELNRRTRVGSWGVKISRKMWNNLWDSTQPVSPDQAATVLRLQAERRLFGPVKISGGLDWARHEAPGGPLCARRAQAQLYMAALGRLDLRLSDGPLSTFNLLPDPTLDTTREVSMAWNAGSAAGGKGLGMAVEYTKRDLSNSPSDQYWRIGLTYR